jgi:hypothetical protein
VPETALSRPFRAPVPSVSGPRLGTCLRSPELEQDRVVEGVYAVAKKERLRTRGGSVPRARARRPERADPGARLSDVDLLDSRSTRATRCGVLGRVDRFRDRLQLESARSSRSRISIRRLSRRPATRRRRARGLPRLPRGRDLARGPEGCRRPVRPATTSCVRASALCPRPVEGTTVTQAGCSSTRSASRPSAARSRSSIRGCAPTCSSPRRCCTTWAAPPS